MPQTMSSCPVSPAAHGTEPRCSRAPVLQGKSLSTAHERGACSCLEMVTLRITREKVQPSPARKRPRLRSSPLQKRLRVQWMMSGRQRAAMRVSSGIMHYSSCCRQKWGIYWTCVRSSPCVPLPRETSAYTHLYADIPRAAPLINSPDVSPLPPLPIRTLNIKPRPLPSVPLLPLYIPPRRPLPVRRPRPTRCEPARVRGSTSGRL